MTRRFIFFLAALAALLVFLFWQFPHAMGSADNKFSVLLSALWLIFLASGLVLHARREDLPQMLRHAGLWVVIIFLLLAAYSYRDVLSNNRIVAELLPSRPQVSGGGAVSFRAADFGHFYIDADVNGVPVRFMVDTGASDIMLTPRDARRAGIDRSNFGSVKLYSTANGTVQGASVILNSIRVGPFTVEHMPASVSAVETGISLLGMSFLQRFDFHIRGDILTLEP